MLICSIDTSGRNGSLALARYDGDATSPNVAHLQQQSLISLKGGEYSAQLIPTLARALKEQHLEKSALDLFVVASGPGSFTGLRVGLSTVKALADALHKPAVAVSVLEAVALAIRAQGTVIAALDAQRGEVFAGEYQISAKLGVFPLRVEHEALSPIDAFCARMKALATRPLIVTPDAAIVEKLKQAGVESKLIERPAADFFAIVGLQKFGAGQTISPEELDANYIRRSDAEIFSAPKAGT